jgi:dTDP-glucose 4,6-dehydratase
MRILITGAAGFIASNLTDLLLAQGHEVVGVDNFITGRRENIAHLSNNKSFSLIEHDVIKPLAVNGDVDRIYHLASPASPDAYKRHRVATIQVNAAGTWNMLELACAKDARLLVASTSEIYGDPNKPVQREDFWGNVNPIGLRSMYEEAKRFAEATVMAYHRERGCDTRIVRIFNTYGPRMHPRDGRVVTNFVRQALSNEPLTVAGDGTQSRSFCYVSDTIRGLAAAMECDFHEPINIGNPTETTILELARTIIDLVPGTRSQVHFEPRSDYDPLSRCPDISRAKQLLNWTPQVSLRDGLAKVVEYHRTESR